MHFATTVERRTMTDDMTFEAAVKFARKHALDGIQRYPFDAVYRATLDQLELIEATMSQGLRLQDIPRTGVDLGLMAAKELGNDEEEFASALSVIQHDLDRSKGSSA